MCPNSNKRHAWTIAETCSCMVIHLTSSLHTWWFHLIRNSFHRHHWLTMTASVLCTNLLVTTQHSEPYRKMRRMQVLFSFSLVEMEILDFQIWLSGSAYLHEWWHCDVRYQDSFELYSGQGSQDRQTLQQLQPSALEVWLSMAHPPCCPKHVRYDSAALRQQVSIMTASEKHAKTK